MSVIIPKFGGPMYQQNVPMNKDDEISVGEEDDSDSEDDLDPVEVDWDQLLQPSTLENTEGIHESLAVEEVNIGERRSYEDLVEHVLNLQESVSQITSLALPILFSSLAEFMETSANGNRNILEKWTNLERGHMTLEELRAKCKHDKMIFLSGDLGGSDLEKKPLNLAPATRDSSVAGERITWSVDVDSVDVLSIPSGGCVFGICEVRIPNTFQPHMIAPRNVLKKNNNLCNVYQYDDEQYPGNYFLRDIFGRRSSPSNTESIFDPIAFKVFDVKLSFCIDPIPLYAVVPYLCLKLLMEGGGSLLQLFLNSMTVDEKKSTVSSNERRSLCYKTVWYMFTEFLLMAMRKVSAPVNFNKFQTRLPCCAVPRVISNKAQHIRRKANSSIESVSISAGKGRLSLALNYMERMFRALEFFCIFPLMIEYRNTRIPTTLKPLDICFVISVGPQL